MADNPTAKFQEKVQFTRSIEKTDESIIDLVRNYLKYLNVIQR